MSRKSPYEDIIDLPHHVSETRPRMSMLDRAAQFSPFAALSGYEDAVRESARLTSERIELAEDALCELDEKLRRAADTGGTVRATYFVPDAKKQGGEYVSVTGRVKRVDSVEGVLVMSGGERIKLDAVADVGEANRDR